MSDLPDNSEDAEIQAHSVNHTTSKKGSGKKYGGKEKAPTTKGTAKIAKKKVSAPAPIDSPSAEVSEDAPVLRRMRRKRK